MSTESGVFDAIAATALAGLVWEAAKAYRGSAPSLGDLRAATSNEPQMLQTLIDTDITVGIPVILAGAIASWLMRSWLPIGIVALALIGVAGYHHSILSDD
jgi:hypothetical protein